MNALAAALVAAQKEMPAVTKDSVNPHFGSRFVSLDHLIATTRPHLAKHGLAIVQQLATSDSGAPAITTTLLHESGEQITSTLPLPLVTDMQKLGAAITYGRRYAWASVLGITDEDDDDGNKVSGAGAIPAAAGAGGGTDGDQAAARVSPDGGLGAQAGPGSETGPAATSDGWVFPFGKHKGKPIADVPDDYLDWVLAQDGKFEDVKDRIAAHRLGAIGADPYDDDDIPFLPTIDGLGN